MPKTEAAHTPESKTPGTYRVDSNGYIEVIRPGSTLMSVQTGKHTGLDTSEIAQLVQQANAVPDLLAACEKLAAWDKESDLNVADRLLSEACSQARAAIRKAEGDA